MASETVVSSVAEFDDVSQQVLGNYFDDENMTINLKNFIEGCQYACTANLNWGYDGLLSFFIDVCTGNRSLTPSSLRSARYKLASDSLKGGLRVTLE